MGRVSTKASSEVHSLECMEVWGGNASASTALSVTGLDVTIWSRPWRDHSEGGDIFFVSMCGCAAISRFMLADVAGHGQRVAPLARRLRHLMSKHINRPDQTRLAGELNRELNRQDAARFATALLLTYLPGEDVLAVCNAGHPPPLLYRAAESSWRTLAPGEPESGFNLPLGVVPGTDYCQFSLPLAPGDRVVLYSDGLIEGSNEQGQPIGVSGLRQRVAAAKVDSSEHLAARLVDAATDAGSAEDDRTVVVLAHNAKDPPRQSPLEKLRVMTRMMVPPPLRM